LIVTALHANKLSGESSHALLKHEFSQVVIRLAQPKGDHKQSKINAKLLMVITLKPLGVTGSGKTLR
jgi:hypothetical protein